MASSALSAHFRIHFFVVVPLRDSDSFIVRLVTDDGLKMILFPSHIFLRLLIAISVCSIAVSALECIQCAPNSAWYSEQEEERRIEACRQGLVAPSKCLNSTHTHCIVNWYRTGGSSERIVTKRHCGMESDVTGCTLYNSKISRKVRRHLLSRDVSHDRKESVASFVEVCSTSCPVGECVNSSNLRGSIIFPIIFATIYRILQ